VEVDEMRSHVQMLRIIPFIVIISLTTVGVLGESVLNFPRLSNEEGTITGVTFFNPNPEEAQVEVTAYRANGTLFSGFTNPAQVAVPGGQQLGLLTSQLFPGLSENTVGWFQAKSPADGITGFFLFLNNPADPTLMDGADLPPTERKVIFNQIRVGNGYATEVNLVNTERVTTRLDFFLVDGDNVICMPLAGSQDCAFLHLPPLGMLREDIADFFEVDELSESAYLLILSDTLVSGFELVTKEGADVLGLNARSAAEQFNTIYFPQLAVLGPWVMEIGLTNYAPGSINLIISARKPDGSLYVDEVQQNPVTRGLLGGEGLRENVETMFGFSGNKPLDGWVEVESTSSAVNGYVTYGVPAAGSVAGVAAPSRAMRNAAFSHIATTRGFFTGVAALNSSSQVSDVRIAAMSAAGDLRGTFDKALGPGERISKTLSEMIPAAAGMAGGIVWVQSSRPVFLTSLFGTTSGKVLSNIPPQETPEVYMPDSGLPRADAMPDLVILKPEDTAEFQIMGADDGGAPGWSLDGIGGGNSDLGTILVDGSYFAPAVLPSTNPIAATYSNLVEVADGPDVELAAGATIDLIDKFPVEAGLTRTRALAFFPGSGDLFSVDFNSSTGSSTVSWIGSESSETVLIFGQFEVMDMIAYSSSAGQEFLLLAGSDRLIRLDPFPQPPQTATLLTGLSDPLQVLALDPVTGNLLASDGASIVEISGALLEADLVSGQTPNGSPPRVLFQSAGVGGLGVDGCTGLIYFSNGNAGDVRSFDRSSRLVELVADELTGPGRLLPLYRQDAVCGDSFHLLASEPGADRISLVIPGEDSVKHWFAVDNPSDLELIPPGPNPDDGAFVLVVEGSTGQPANPFDANAVGVIADPAGDNYGILAAVQQDIVEASAVSDGNDLNLEVFFADPISPCVQPCDDSNLNDPNAVTGFIDLDLDQDRTTGLLADTDLNSPYTSALGIDFSIDLLTHDEGEVEVYRILENDFEFVGVLPIEFETRSFRMALPLNVLQDDGLVNVSFVLGTSQEPTDVAPNYPYLSSGPGPAGLLAALTPEKPAKVLNSGASSKTRGHESGGRGWKRVRDRFRK
jgi:hypothetical protein